MPEDNQKSVVPRVKYAGPCWEPAITVRQLLICEAVTHDLSTPRVLQGHPVFSFLSTQEYHLEQGSSTGEQASLGMVFFCASHVHYL